jgi:ribonuclease P protein component
MKSQVFCTLKKNTSFQNIFQKGHSINGKYLVVYFLLNSFNYNRYGFCSGKKLGTAVIRNRIKRRLRAVVYELNPVCSQGYDILLVARASIREANFEQIIADLKGILAKAKIIN